MARDRAVPAAAGRRDGRTWPMREILNAIFYVLRGGIAWRLLPTDLPPKSTVYGCFAAGATAACSRGSTTIWSWRTASELAGRPSPTAVVHRQPEREDDGERRTTRLRCGQECASTARIIYGGRFHPESCRLIRKLTSGLAGQPAGSKPRDKGRLGRSSDPTGRNVSEVRAGLERVDADADPSLARGRPRGQGSNRHMHLFGLPGYWTQHVGRVMRVIEGDPSGSRVAASTSPRAADPGGRRTGSYDR